MKRRQMDPQYDAGSGSEDGGSAHSGRSVGFSGPLTRTKRGGLGRKKSGRLAPPPDHHQINHDHDQEYVEITLDVRDDGVSIQEIKGADPDHNQEAALLTEHFQQANNNNNNNTTTSGAAGNNNRGGGPPPPRRLTSQLSAKMIKHYVSKELRRVASLSSRKEKTIHYDRAKSTAALALRGLQFINKSRVGDQGWIEVENRFEQLAVDGLLPKSRFGQCIGMSEKEFASELFDALARRRGIVMAMITKAQLKDFWEQLSDQSFDARVQTFFDMVDKNADGRITEEEVREIISLSASANKLSKIQEHAEEYAALIMEELDPDGLGYIEIYNLETLLLQGGPGQPHNSSSDTRKLSQLLSQKLVPTKERNPIKRWFRRLTYFLQDNWKRVWVILLWISICCTLFVWKFVQYKHRYVYHVMGACVSTAKGGAEILKFNMALILFPVCRNFITFLRSRTKLGAIVPFNDNINFHKVVAIGVAVGLVLHAGAHLTCDFPKLLHASDAEYAPLAQYFGAEKPPNYWWFVKGTEGWTGVVMVVLMAIAYTLAQPWFRRNRVNLPTCLKRLTGFNAFWYSHHLFVIVYVLLIVHGEKLYLQPIWHKRTTWMYLAVPMGIYAIERLIRSFRSNYKISVQVLKVAVYPGNVLSLYMTKPHGFKYTSGQYIFVNCSDVSPFEWHPFSLTSAPSDDYISLHIRTLGDWTSQLKSTFSKVCQLPRTDQSGLLRADLAPGNHRPRMPKLLIDGPYGAPAQDYKNYDVLLLVGLGIGATPLISIVKDVVNNLKQQKDASTHDLESAPEWLGNSGRSSKKSSRSNSSAASSSPFAVKRAYFYWVTREEGSFEWFRGVMNEAAEYDQDHVIELHNYCTSVYEEGDARSALIAMLQSLHHAKSGVDIVSGTRVKTHFARPNWRAVFKHVAINHGDQRVGVFYCGAPGLTSELRHLAQDFSRKTTTKFDFHKENF